MKEKKKRFLKEEGRLVLATILVAMLLFSHATVGLCLGSKSFKGSGGSTGGGGGGENVTVNYVAYDLDSCGELKGWTEANYNSNTGKVHSIKTGGNVSESYSFLNQQGVYKTISFSYTRSGGGWNSSHSNVPAWAALWINYVYTDSDGGQHKVNLYPAKQNSYCMPKYQSELDGAVWGTRQPNVIPIGGWHNPGFYGSGTRFYHVCPESNGGYSSSGIAGGGKTEYTITVTPFFRKPSDQMLQAAEGGWEAKAEGKSADEYFPFEGSKYSPSGWRGWISPTPLEQVWKEQRGLSGYLEILVRVYNYRGIQIAEHRATDLIDLSFILPPGVNPLFQFYLPFPDTEVVLKGPRWWLDDGSPAVYELDRSRLVDWRSWNALRGTETLTKRIFGVTDALYAENLKSAKLYLKWVSGAKEEPTDQQAKKFLDDLAIDILDEMISALTLDAKGTTVALIPQKKGERDRWVTKGGDGKFSLSLTFDRPTPPNDPVTIKAEGIVALNKPQKGRHFKDFYDPKQKTGEFFRVLGAISGNGKILGNTPGPEGQGVDIFEAVSSLSSLFKKTLPETVLKTYVLSSWLSR